MVRKFIVEIVEARHLMPKDGEGSSSPYVQVDFYNQRKGSSQRKNTQTVVRNLHPVWNETLSFNVSSLFDKSMLKLIVYHDQKVCKIYRDNFLGQIELSSALFVPKGKEVLQYYQLRNSWARCFQLKMIKDESEIGLKIYYVDEEEVSPLPPPSQDPPPPPPRQIEEVIPNNDVTTPPQESSQESPATPPPPPPQIEEVMPNNVTTPPQEPWQETTLPQPQPSPQIHPKYNDVTTSEELGRKPTAVFEIIEEPPEPQAEPAREKPPATVGSTDQVKPTTPAIRNILRKTIGCQNFVGKIFKTTSLRKLTRTIQFKK